MAGVNSYKVSRVAQAVYLDDKGQPVNGFTLTVELPEFGETIAVNVPTTDPKAAKKVIEAYIADRRALAELSG